MGDGRCAGERSSPFLAGDAFLESFDAWDDEMVLEGNQKWTIG